MVDEGEEEFVREMKEKALSGEGITVKEAERLAEAPLEPVVNAADEIREKNMGDGVDTCSIINAKAGNCAEDCGFCAQSTHFDTDIDTHEYLEPDEIVEAAKRAEEDGANRFGIVVAERGINKEKRPEEFEKVLESVRRIRDETGIEPDASLGLITEEEARELRDAGLKHFNHNIETAPSYFDNVVTTHDFEDRVEAIEVAKEAGMHVCAGVILGMGEEMHHRIEAAHELRRIGVDTVPVNILNPVPGTPFEDYSKITVDEILKSVAIYRFMMPEKVIRLTGGREQNLKDRQSDVLEAGANGLLIGDYLTSEGQNADEDQEMIESIGMEIEDVEGKAG
ncbi:MAG: biotin synthase BioB [Halobacteria archaeon]|nr:biotin synthase BioB [Halobacteria archaeon]